MLLNPADFALHATLFEVNDAENMRTLILWDARVRRDMLLAPEQVEIFDLEIAPIVPQNYELLLAREMIKVVEFDYEEFAIVGIVVVALQHKRVEALTPGFSQSVLFALSATGCSCSTLFGTRLSLGDHQSF